MCTSAQSIVITRIHRSSHIPILRTMMIVLLSLIDPVSFAYWQSVRTFHHQICFDSLLALTTPYLDKENCSCLGECTQSADSHAAMNRVMAVFT